MLHRAILNFLRHGTRRRSAVAGVIVGLLLTIFPRLLYLPVADSATQTYFETSLVAAGASYLTCRTLIGGLDSIEHSQLSIEPWGIGVDEEPGRLTDPLRDVAERASDVLFTAVVTLTVEEIGYEIMRTLGDQIIGVVLLLLSLSLIITPRVQRLATITSRSLILLLALRVALPISAAFGTEVNRTVFFPEIRATSAAIQDVIPAEKIKAMSDWSLPKAHFHWLSPDHFIKAYFSYLWEKLSAIVGVTGAITLHMASLADNLTKLSGLYAAQILFQSLLIPLAVFWFLRKLCSYMFSLQLPPVLKPEMLQRSGTQTTPRPTDQTSLSST